MQHSQGLPGWASREDHQEDQNEEEHKKNFRKNEKKQQENEAILRKCSDLAHLGVKGWLRP